MSKTLGDYGGVKKNAEIIRNSEQELDATEWNHVATDTAQGTRRGDQVSFEFKTTTSVAPASVTINKTSTRWGTNSIYVPTSATKTATGVYQFIFPSTFLNDLSESEDVLLSWGWHSIASPTVFGLVNVTASGNTVTVYVANTSGTLSDLTDATPIQIFTK